MERDGISIGEAAGFVLLERPERADHGGGIVLLGVGESQRRLPHVVAASRRFRREAGNGKSPRGRAANPSRYRLYQSPRYSDQGRRRCRRPRCLKPVRDIDALLLHQGAYRSHARCRWGHRSDHFSALHPAWVYPGKPDNKESRSGLEKPLSRRWSQSAFRSGHDEFFRLRREQLQPDFRTPFVKLYLDGVGLTGPGFRDWEAGRAILAGREDYQSADSPLKPCPLLPAAERRRMTDTVKLALAIGCEAMDAAGANPHETPAVFASSGGDGKTITAILECLAVPERDVSPTRFHNSYTMRRPGTGASRHNPAPPRRAFVPMISALARVFSKPRSKPAPITPPSSWPPTIYVIRRHSMTSDRSMGFSGSVSFCRRSGAIAVSPA